MNMTKLDEQDERNFEATRRAEERILSMWKIAATIVLITGEAIGMLLMRTVDNNINVWLGIFIIATMCLMFFIEYELITTCIKATHAEFRKLEGFVSISTLTLVESIERENKGETNERLDREQK